jgi:hypothetical protein
VSAEQLDDVCPADRGDRQADTQDPGDLAALGDRDLVGEHRHHRREQTVVEQLGDAPPDQDDRDVGGHRDEEDAERAAEWP